MKTNLFIAAALFLSAGTYAQTISSSAAQSSSTTASVNKKRADISTASSTHATVGSNAAEKASGISSEAKQEAKTTVHAVSATNAKLKSTVTKTVQPKPVAIKTQARIAATGGIKIK